MKLWGLEVVESCGVPPGTVMIVTPGEYVDVTTPDGRTRRVEIKTPSGAIITGIGIPEVPVAKG